MSLFLIAEIGINHNGDMSIAKQLINSAADAGFDAVKFQKRTIDHVYTQEFLDSPRESPWGTTQRAQKEGLEFTKDQYKEISDYCAIKKIYPGLLPLGIYRPRSLSITLIARLIKWHRQCLVTSLYLN